MIILGIDPSYTRTGLAAIEDHGIPGRERILGTHTIATKPGTSDLERSRTIARMCANLARVHKADAVAIESQYAGQQNMQVAMRLASLRSAIEQRLRDTYAEDRIVAVTPGERAEALGIKGRLKRVELKQRVLQAVKQRYDYTLDFDDEADAVGIALAAGRRLRRGEKAEQLRMTLQAKQKARL